MQRPLFRLTLLIRFGCLLVMTAATGADDGNTPKPSSPAEARSKVLTPQQEYAALQKEKAALIKDRKKGIQASAKDAVEKQNWYKEQLNGKVHPDTRKQIEESIADYEKVITREKRIVEIGKRLAKLKDIVNKPGEAIVFDEKTLSEVEKAGVSEPEDQARIASQLKELENLYDIRTPSGLMAWEKAAENLELRAKSNEDRATQLWEAAEGSDEWASRVQRNSQYLKDLRGEVAIQDESGNHDQSIKEDLQRYDNRARESINEADTMRADAVKTRHEAEIYAAIAKDARARVSAEKARMEAMRKAASGTR